MYQGNAPSNESEHAAYEIDQEMQQHASELAFDIAYGEALTELNEEDEHDALVIELLYNDERLAELKKLVLDKVAQHLAHERVTS